MSEARRGRARGAWALVMVTGIALAAALAPSGCLTRRDDPPLREDTRCAECHGDPTRAGDYLRKAAPPKDLLGASRPAYPGVGAHARHLDGSDRHAAIACVACHVVPKEVSDPGHADHLPPAEIVFDPTASLGGDGTYDPARRTCAETYCHGDAQPDWTNPRSPDAACGTCHGLPPAAPHPQSDRCSVCHAEVVDASRAIIAPELHVDGTVQAQVVSCTSCHGSGDDPAPPVDTSGSDARSSIGVGAHQAHLSGGSASRALPCETCHTVPSLDDKPEAHVDGDPAPVALEGIATTNGRAPIWDHGSATCSDTWCHDHPGATTPVPTWTSETPLDCTSCHGAPPPPPHPVMDDCSMCHGAVVDDDDRTIKNRDLHVNGVVDVDVPTSCTACHGGTDPGPPPDLLGRTDTTLTTVGAHRTHVDGTGLARPVPCGECHVVPSEVLAKGHIDTPRPAEVTFSGVALAYGGAPAFDGTSCTGTCHGPTFPNGRPTNGTNTAPTWTRVGQGEAACGTCHELPPRRDHPVPSLNPVCSACHENIDPDNATFNRPDLHVDGVVTFELPN